MKNKIWKVGVYIRISRDDMYSKESNSIINQRNYLTEYLLQEKMEIYDYYVDDGYTGTDFNRPAFMRMFNDIKEGKINTIIVKDLSRLGRNYIFLGEYLEHIFPLYDLRVISLNDNLDNFKDPECFNNILVPFKNLLNDEYARDISIKVKSSLNAKRYNGEFVGSIAPFGYLKDPNNKNKLIIDKDASKTVELIFSLALKNYSYSKIASYLNEMHILNPATYREINFNQRNNRNYLNKNNTWSSSSISSILKNRVYCGDLVQSKTKTISYKVHKIVRKDLEDMIIVENTHPPIINRTDFKKVQEIVKERTRAANTTGSTSLFTGYLRCYECQYKMRKSKAGYKDDHKTRDYYYYCSTYRNKSKELCSSHRVTGKFLEEKVFEEINKKISSCLSNSEKIDDYWLKEFKKYHNLDKLNKNMLDSLVKTIYIHNNLDVTIVYKYEQ